MMNRLRPNAWFRYASLVSCVALTLVTPSRGWAQVLQSFEDLPLRVNLNDHVQLENQTGARVNGRVTLLTRNAVTIHTTAGEKRFTGDAVRAIAVRGHALQRGAWIGAGVFAVLGAVAICSNRGGAGCGIVGALGAAPIGAGVGLAIGAVSSQWKPVYRAAESGVSIPSSRAASGVQASFVDDLALRVNLDDRLRVDDQSGRRVTGRLTHLTDNALTIQTGAGKEHLTRETVRQVAVRRHPLRAAVLVGAGAGTATGALAACTGPERNECADAAILGSAFGAGLGLVVGALMHTTTIVYPEPMSRTHVLPVISRDTVGVRITRRW